jgi:hypothetical protein
MRYLILFLFSVLFTPSAQSQIYEIGVFGGGSNFIGDVGATNYIAPKDPAIGLLLKWNRSPRHSWRVSIIYADIAGEDKKSDDPRRKERNYSFDNNLIEISAGMEFTFFDFNLHGTGHKSTPYLYTGITTAKHDNYRFSQNGAYTSENTTSWAYGIPMVLGYKIALTNHFILGAEVGARYTFSDELDGSVPDSQHLQSLSFGNINSNDWYVFSGFTLTYTFGQRPCYCNF